MIEFDVKNQIIKRTDDFAVVADSRNYLTAKFSFTEEWNENTIVIFGREEEYFHVVLSGDICIVPWEVIKPPFFTVSLVCGDRITSNSIRIDVEKSGFKEGKEPKPPTPDMYEQLLSSIRVPQIGENGNWFVWDAKTRQLEDSNVAARAKDGYTPQKDIDYFDGNDGYTPQKGVDYFDGNDGYTPQKGVDYFDGNDGYTPQKGVDYFDGEDGYTPQKGVDYFDGYTPVKGKDYFDGEDGYTPVKGKDYFDGEAGYTPQRGIDYWTEEDKEEMKAYLNEVILGGAW